MSELEPQILNTSVEEVMKTSYLDYSMSVIVGRALPDIRDGLKPVQRRVLFAMSEEGLEYGKARRKSSNVCGIVMGRYHPHGDSSIYEALVRLAQPFSLRYPLVDGQGNFGSIDGDDAAAMRYTEARLHKIAGELLADLDKNTVDFLPNYDSSLEEPSVLPAKFPNLLVNGSGGIAVGMATNIPPHNLTELMNALIHLIDHPEAAPESLFSIVKGPDFPTRAAILGTTGIINAYKTGKGSIRIRSKAVFEELKNGKIQIVVTEIPYQVNKSALIEKIAELVRDKKITGIADLRDESTDDVRIVIELKRGETASVILNQLYKNTQLETTFGINMVALLRGRPKTVSLYEILDEFINHRILVVIRRTNFLLKKAEDRAHIIEGLITAVENIDEVVRIIKSSADVSEAKSRLKQRFSLSDAQSAAIMDMRLARLTGLEIDKLQNEYSQLMKDIAYYKNILENRSELMKLIRTEFEEVRGKFGDERLTQIVDAPNDDIADIDLISNDEMVVTVTHNGYIKRTPLTNFSAQKRGGKGKSGASSKVDDFVEQILVTTNHSKLLCFTATGSVHFLNIYNLPEMNRDTKGRHISNFIALEPSDRIAATLTTESKDEDKTIVFVTKKGVIKNIAVHEFRSGRNGMLVLKLAEDDNLVATLITSENDRIFIATRFAKCIQFLSKDIRVSRRRSGGVKGIKLAAKDEVVSVDVINDDGGDIMTITAAGYGKRTSIEEYREQSRGGSGLKLCKITKKTGYVAGVLQVLPTDDVMLITKSGKTIRFAATDISTFSRATQGVRLMDTAGDEIISVAVIKDIQEDLG
ncbi:MAG: DNA gyrase subunit A [Deferribacteraceae bacterium]|jgi:DNA gyrase subunit A|nr:DNA gyrase subunit A [Deferribacteraceae bacterium]